MRVISGKNLQRKLSENGSGGDDNLQARHALNTANAFFLASGRAFETKVAEGKFESAKIPAIVCAAFSIELALKANIAFQGDADKLKKLKSSDRHNLFKLFELLLVETQDEIFIGTKLAKSEFLEKIQTISNAFVDWRYVYEKDEISIDYTFLNDFAQTLNSR